MKILHLNLKAEYFYQIKIREKYFEYRLINEYWSKRLVDKDYEAIFIKMGYPKSDDFGKIEVRPYRGYRIFNDFNHPHFGAKPVSVFAIRVN